MIAARERLGRRPTGGARRRGGGRIGRTVVDRETLEEEGAQAGAGAAADGVEGKEALQAGAVVGQLADAVEDEVDDLLADGVCAGAGRQGRGWVVRQGESRPACDARGDLWLAGRLSDGS